MEFQPAKTKTGQNRTKQLKQKLVTVLIIGTNILKKGLSRRHWILHIWIRRGTKFHLKQIILNFWKKFSQQQSFQYKTKKKWTPPSKNCIFKLLSNLNYTWNKQSSVCGPNLSKKGISGLKLKKRISAPIFVYWN